MNKKFLAGWIILTTGIFSVLNLSTREYGIAIFAFGLGLAWLVLELQEQRSLSTSFFLLFLVLALMTMFENLPVPIVLLGLSTNLGAWDLSQFQHRIDKDGDLQMTLPKKHIQRLLMTLSLGFIVSLLPIFITVSLSFVVMAGFLLIILLALRTFALDFLTQRSLKNVSQRQVSSLLH